jgi:hypothetical protein
MHFPEHIPLGEGNNRDSPEKLGKVIETTYREGTFDFADSPYRGRCRPRYLWDTGSLGPGGSHLALETFEDRYVLSGRV